MIPFIFTTIFASYAYPKRQKSTYLVFFIFPSTSQLHIGNQLLQNDPCCQRAKASYSARTEVLVSPNFQGRLREVHRTGAGTSGILQGATWALLEELPYSCAMNIERQTTKFQTTSEETMYYSVHTLTYDHLRRHQSTDKPSQPDPQCQPMTQPQGSPQQARQGAALGRLRKAASCCHPDRYPMATQSWCFPVCKDNAIYLGSTNPT